MREGSRRREVWREEADGDGMLREKGCSESTGVSSSLSGGENQFHQIRESVLTS